MNALNFTSFPQIFFSILYIHCFVYTVYDDISGQQSVSGDSGQNIAHHHTDYTATKTDTGGFLTLHPVSYIILQYQYKIVMKVVFTMLL